MSQNQKVKTKFLMNFSKSFFVERQPRSESDMAEEASRLREYFEQSTYMS